MVSKRWRLPFNVKQPSAPLYLAGHLTVQWKTESQSPCVHFCISERPAFNVLLVLQEEPSGSSASSARCNWSLSVFKKAGELSQGKQWKNLIPVNPLDRNDRFFFYSLLKDHSFMDILPYLLHALKKTTLFLSCNCASTVRRVQSLSRQVAVDKLWLLHGMKALQSYSDLGHGPSWFLTLL